MKQWMEIRSLSASGLGIRAIARRLRLSRNTVRRVLRGEDAFLKKKERQSFSQLLPFQEEIVRMLRAGLIGTRILHELRRKGYSGGKTPFYLFLKQLRKDFPKRKMSPICRFETAPGLQGQFDWSTYRIPLGGIMTRVVIYCLLLAYSRRKFYWPSLQETQEAVFEALERGFSHFGGIPQEILIDNARVFVKDPRPSHFQWNPRFLEFCRHYQIIPRACRIRSSETKGESGKAIFFTWRSTS